MWGCIRATKGASRNKGWWRVKNYHFKYFAKKESYIHFYLLLFTLSPLHPFS